MKRKAGIPKPDKSSQLLDEVERILPRMVANQPLFARLTRAKYVALLKAGFDEKQALELCK